MLPRQLRIVLPILFLATRAPLGQAQSAPPRTAEVFAGSGLEEYARVLQVAGEAKPYPWSIRAFSERELDRFLPADSANPWSARYGLRADTTRAPRFRLIAPTVQGIYNSAFPFGFNDGPVWAGKGLTTVVQAGFSARYGPVSLTVAPILWRAANAGFELERNLNREPFSPYADANFPHWIDLPQRFGDRPYQRLEPGQSTLRVDLPVVTAGVSTANQYWGPASENPLLLGNNASGFPHVFVGTSAPVNLWIARLHGRFIWGSLDQSDYSPVTTGETRRFMTGAVAVLQPRGVPGLELGVARFFHNIWPEEGLSVGLLNQPLQSLLKVGLPIGSLFSDGGDEVLKSSADNQLASVFARWVVPRSGFELYGEFGREDHNYDFRDLATAPNHAAGYMVGARKVWKRSPDRLLSLRGEILNTQISHEAIFRGQWPFYIHSSTKQGHTQRGQALGSAFGYSGEAAVVSLDAYTPRGGWTVDWRRMLRYEWGEYWIEEGTTFGEKGVDVDHALGVSALFFLGRFDVSARASGVYNLNRYFGEDAVNWNTSITVRATP